MKATKRISAIFLALVLALSLLPVSVFAAGSDYSTRLLVDKVADDKVDVKWMVQTSNGAVMKTTNSIVFKYDHTKYDMLTNDGEVITTKTMSDNLCGEYVTSEYAQRVTVFDSPALWDNSGIYAEANGNWTFVLINLACSKPALKKEYTTETALAVIHLQLKSGAVGDGLPGGSIALATTTEASSCGQSGIVIFIGVGEEQFIYGRTDSSADTLLTTPAVAPGTDVTFALPAYSGTIAAPTVDSNKGGKVVLNDAVLTPADSAAKIQYGYSTSASTAPTTWQDGTTFSGLTVGDTLYFYAKVVGTTTYAEKVSDASAPVTVLDKSLTGLTVTAQPSTKTYAHGETLDTTGMVVKATYDDGTSDDDFKNYTVEYETSSKNYLCKGNSKVTLNAGSKSVEVTGLTVNAKELTVTGLTAENREYKPGDTLVTLTGGTLNGVVGSEDVSLLSTPTTGTISNAGVGNNKDVSITTLSLTGVDAGNYTLTQPTGIKVNITPKDIAGANIAFGPQATYDGNSHTANYTVTDGTYTLVKDTDYTVRTNTDTATDVQSMYLYIDGIGNYKDAKSGVWTLQKATPTATDFDTSGLAASYSYNGSEQTAPIPTTAKTGMGTVTVNYPGGTTPKFVGDYNLQFSVAEGQNYNEAGPFTYGTMKIVAAAQTPTFTTPVNLAKGGAMLDLRTLVSGAKGNMTFTIASGTAATLSGYTLTSTGITGAVTIKVSITAKDVNSDGKNEYNAFNKSDAITVNVIDKTTDTTTMKVSQDDITYGETVSPSVPNKPADTGTVSYTYEGRDGTTYSSSATAPTNVGKYKVKAKCESSSVIYKAEDTFEILPKSISGMTVTLDKTSLEYNASAQTVNVTVKDGTSTLIKDTDYTVTGATSGTNVNSYTVTVTGKGNYKGSVDRTWKITQATPTYTVPTGLTAKYGQTLADITLPTGWNWMDSTQSVGDASTTAKTFKAKFTPADAINYKTVENINVSVAVGKADAPTLADIPVSQKYTVTTGEKAIGAVMPADAGALTYTEGTASKTGSVTVTSWNVDPAGKVTYTLSGGAAGDTVTLPVIIKSTNYADTTVKVVITLTAKDDQAALTLTGETTVVYGQTLQLGTSGGNGNGAVTYTVTPGTGTATVDATGKLTPTKVGTVTVTATKAADANYNSSTSAPVTITITKATPTGEPKYTAITTSGKTLADAGLTTTGSNLSAPGTVKWVDDTGADLPATTTVEANTTYKWLFTPTDTNYTTLTGSIQLWHKSTSSGGGSYYAPTVPDMPMLYRGCTGDAVKTLQEKLNAKGFDSGNVDGIFGAKTYAAATAFQKANGLGVDGIVGKLTWAKLYDATPVNVTPVTTQPMLRTGSRGDAVRKLQELLNAKGYTCGSVDGIFGSKTYAAVLAFQKANGLAADGIVGSLTWGKLV